MCIIFIFGKIQNPCFTFWFPQDQNFKKNVKDSTFFTSPLLCQHGKRNRELEKRFFLNLMLHATKMKPFR